MLKTILIAGALIAASSAASSQPHSGGNPFEAADTNDDGMVVRDEFIAARAELFARMDRNSDGFIDEADRAEHEAEHRRGERGKRRHARMDSDGDGKLSKDEFVSAGTPLFDRMDTDHDSVLSSAELEAAKSRAKQMRKIRPDRAATQQ